MLTRKIGFDDLYPPVIASAMNLEYSGSFSAQVLPAYVKQQHKAWSKLVGDCVSGVWPTVYLCAGICGRNIFYLCLQNYMITLG